MILNNEQAHAVYNAMVALNNVSGRIHARIPTPSPDAYIHVRQYIDDTISIWYGNFGGHPISRTTEAYDNQNVFAVKYGVN